MRPWNIKTGWLWVIWAALAGVIMLAPLPSKAAPPVERFFSLTASQFSYAPAVLRANPGDRVTIELRSEDVVHGLAVDGYNLDMTADPGQPARLTFVADQPGLFRFRCSVTCGNMHPFMIGKLQVGPNTLYWRAAALGLLALAAGSWRLRP